MKHRVATAREGLLRRGLGRVFLPMMIRGEG